MPHRIQLLEAIAIKLELLLYNRQWRHFLQHFSDICEFYFL